MSPSTTHTPKRQNRTIINTSSPSLAPPLPSHIQSSLLTVGMRVRKSIANGYKTKTTSFPPLLSTSICSEQQDTSISPPSSQESIPDNGISGGNELKRTFSEQGIHVDDVEEDGEEIGLHQQQRSAFDLLMANRHLAIPKSQKKVRDARRRGYHAAVKRGEGPQAKLVKEVDGMDDFGEAGFLRPVEEVEGMEVDI